MVTEGTEKSFDVEAAAKQICNAYPWQNVAVPIFIMVCVAAAIFLSSGVGYNAGYDAGNRDGVNAGVKAGKEDALKQVYREAARYNQGAYRVHPGTGELEFEWSYRKEK